MGTKRRKGPEKTLSACQLDFQDSCPAVDRCSGVIRALVPDACGQTWDCRGLQAVVCSSNSSPSTVGGLIPEQAARCVGYPPATGRTGLGGWQQRVETAPEPGFGLVVEKLRVPKERNLKQEPPVAAVTCERTLSLPCTLRHCTNSPLHTNGAGRLIKLPFKKDPENSQQLEAGTGGGLWEQRGRAGGVDSTRTGGGRWSTETGDLWFATCNS